MQLWFGQLLVQAMGDGSRVNSGADDESGVIDFDVSFGILAGGVLVEGGFCVITSLAWE